MQPNTTSQRPFPSDAEIRSALASCGIRTLADANRYRREIDASLARMARRFWLFGFAVPLVGILASVSALVASVLP